MASSFKIFKTRQSVAGKNIMEFSESDKTGVWITTQIVEASLDIDFDILYTEMSTADSLYREWEDVIEKEDIVRKKQIFMYMLVKWGWKTVYMKRTCISGH